MAPEMPPFLTSTVLQKSSAEGQFDQPSATIIDASTTAAATPAPPIHAGSSRVTPAAGACATSDLRQRDALLALVLAAAILVRGFANLVGLEEDHLRDAFVGIDLRGQRRGVGELERDVAFPLGLEGRYVHYDPASRIRGIVYDDTIRHEILKLRNGEVVHLLDTCRRDRIDDIPDRSVQRLFERPIGQLRHQLAQEGMTKRWFRRGV